MWIKRIVMIDVVTLAMLYAIRVIAGAFATAQTVTFWLLAFCVFIFLSLAFLHKGGTATVNASGDCCGAMRAGGSFTESRGS